MKLFAAAAAAALAAVAGPASAKTYLLDRFEGDSFDKNWVKSSWKSEMGKWDVTSGEWYGDAAAARGMRTLEDARFYAVSRKLSEPFTNEGKPLVIQYAVKNEKKGSSFCAGGYIKLLPSTTDQANFGGDSDYFIMAGPDVCGYDVSRVHLIFRDQASGEKMLKKDDIKLEWADKDEFTHLYTFVINPDDSYEVFVDQKSRSKGSLADGQWSKFVTKEIDDPTDLVKPADWVDEEMMDDPEAKKPADWDEDAPKTIADPNAKKPEDWDEGEDGAWEAPMIPNPAYKGKWSAPRIKNPAYKGPWAPKKIPNPAYTGKNYIYKDIGMVGFELWVVNSGTIFSNIIITDSLEEANKLAEETFKPFVQAEKDAKKAFDDRNKPAEPEKTEAAADSDEDDKDEL